MDGLLKPLAVKSKFNAEDLFEHAAFKDRWDAAVAKLKEEIAAERAAQDVEGGGSGELELAGAAGTGNDPVLVANPTRFTENSTEYWAAFAAQLLRQYIKLIPEPKTVGAIAQAIEDSHLRDVRGTENRNCVIINFEADVASESACRPSERKAPHDESPYKNLIQGALQGRGAQKNKAGECVP